jgi:hypothetical protein
MSVIITEQLQRLINHIKETSGVVDVSITTLAPSTTQFLPDTVINPLQFVISLSFEKTDPETNIVTNVVSNANLILSEQTYNNSILPKVSTEQLGHLINFDNSDDVYCTICDDRCRQNLLSYVDPILNVVRPILGLNNTPVDLTTIEPELHDLATMIENIPGVTGVLLYEVIDEHVKTAVNSDKVYRCYTYFGESRELDGRDNVSTVLLRSYYLDRSHHDDAVANITNLINEYKAKQ